jgi:ferric-dicitrate binding protein FerR (iron transport regulator)
MRVGFPTLSNHADGAWNGLERLMDEPRYRDAPTAEERRMGSRQRRIRARFWVEIALAALTGVLSVLTLIWKDWLEAFGIEPDHHNGTAESLTVAGLFVLSAAFAVSARAEWRLTALAR